VELEVGVGRRSYLWLGLLAVAATAAIAGTLMTCGTRREDPSARTALPSNGVTGVVWKGAAFVQPGEAPHGATEGTLRLEGQVIDEQQQPVAGAEVRLAPDDARVTSETDGSFAFEHLIERRYRLSARKDDLYAEMTSVRLDATSEPAILRMHRGATLIVNVVEDRAPVPGARVILDDATTVVSDAAGVAKLQGLGPNFHWVKVTADGRAPVATSLMLGEDPGDTIERTVTLHRGAAVGGMVLGPDGKHVPEATVEIEGLVDRWSERATTDGAGAWHVDALAAGKYQLHATSKTYGPAPDLTIELDGVTPRRDLMVRVDYDAQLVGTIVDGTGRPVEGAVAIASASITDSFHERTDANGRFELLGIKAATYDVFARKAGQASPSTRVTIANNERAEVRLVVQEASIAGSVVDSKGAPVAEARVKAMPGGRISMAGFADDVTDSHGHFDLGGLEPGEYVVSAAWPDQRDRRLGAGERIKTGTKDVRLVLAQPATLAGRVVLDGKPMPYYGMLLTEHPEWPFMGKPTGVRAPDGRFTIRGVTPGTWGLVLLGPGTALKTIAGLTIEDGKVTDLGEIAMAHGQRIIGHVRDSSNAAVPGARVEIGQPTPGLDDDHLQQWFRGEFETTTDATGGYRFDGISPLSGGSKKRPAQISATHPERGASIATNLPDGDAAIDLVLVPSGGIDGVIEGFTDGVGMVSMRSPAEPAGRRSTQVNGAGEFRFDAIPPGPYTISMIALPGKPAPSPVSVTVVANQRVKATFVMPKSTISLVVKVLGGTCKGIMLTEPGNGPPDPEHAIGFQICAGGEAEFDGVPPGRYRACPDGQACAEVTVASSPAKQIAEIRTAPE